MTYIKMPKKPEDDIKSSKWGIAFLSSVGFGFKKVGGATVIFDLVNMETQRAHRMAWTGAGKKTGKLPFGGAFKNTDYAYFNTTRPANFPDFDQKSATISIKDRLIHSKRSLTVYDGLTALAKVKIGGWGPSVPGGLKGAGLTEIYYSDGRPVETPEFVPKVEPQSEEKFDHNLDIKEFDNGYIFTIAGDILFDYDKDSLHWQAEETLGKVFRFLNSKSGYSRISIEGHTDSKEKTPGHNKKLSARRAQTVLDYFKRNEWALDSKYRFETHGFGADRPIADNTLNGKDNPPGREKNRRVVLYLLKN